MTILPKKKQPKDKSESDSASERAPHSPSGGVQGEGRTGARHVGLPGSPSSVPPRWGSPPPVDPVHDPGPCRYEETSVGVGALGTNKRRLRDRDRSPPTHRNSRKQRHDGGRGGIAGGSCLASTSGTHSYVRLNGLRTGAGPSVSDARACSSQMASEEHSGYNSEDECVPQLRDPNLEEKEHWFEQALQEKRGFIIKRMGEDGACLFRSVADQVYGDEDMHSVVRKLCVDYMAKNCDFFKQYVTEDFNTYLTRKRSDHCHGNHVEMQALCELYNRPIEVYQLSIDPINTFHSSYKTDNEPIRLSYHGNVHYNSVVDPRKATIGVGLGLPGLQPGLADKNLIRDALRQSEDCHIEQTMLEDKLRETDWELTQDTIEEQVARESYLQWLKDQEKYGKMSKTSPRSACATCSTATEAVASVSTWWEQAISPEPRTSRSPHSPAVEQLSAPAPIVPLLPTGMPSSPTCVRPSPAVSSDPAVSLEGAVGGAPAPVPSTSFSETASIMNELPPQMFGFTEWGDDADILAQVIAQSQHEYLASLKKSSATVPKNTDGPPVTGSQDGQATSDDSAVPIADKGKSPMPKDRHT